jgi:hypothetical protein
MKHFRWQVLLGTSLVLLSALVYYLHYVLFHDAHHIFIYLVGDIAFVPVEVLLVTLIIHRLLERREKQSRLEKMNMVIEAFFSEVGTSLLKVFSDCDSGTEEMKKDLSSVDKWSDKDFDVKKKRLADHDFPICMERIDIDDLSAFLLKKRNFSIRLLENQNLLEHESFTDALRAVLHLTEELAVREGLEHRPDKDTEHLAGDIKRAYGRLVLQWLDYMRHLKDNYPYLFSLAMRTNPFDVNASPLVT